MFPAVPARPRLSPHLWWIPVLFLLWAGPAAAMSVHPRAGHNAKQEIEQLEERWRAVQLSGDLTEMEQLMSDDFIGISITGEANTKTQQLDRYRHRQLIITSIALSDSKIKLLGNVAIVTSLAEVEGTNEGEPLHGRYRYTRVYQRVAPHVWKTTNFEVTRIPRGRTGIAQGNMETPVPPVR